MLTIAASVLGGYWGVCSALAIILPVIEHREFIPPARLAARGLTPEPSSLAGLSRPWSSR